MGARNAGAGAALALARAFAAGWSARRARLEHAGRIMARRP
jgi:hypothetical protein